jgi:hypothetical protein
VSLIQRFSRSRRSRAAEWRGISTSGLATIRPQGGHKRVFQDLSGDTFQLARDRGTIGSYRDFRGRSSEDGDECPSQPSLPRPAPT